MMEMMDSIAMFVGYGVLGLVALVLVLSVIAEADVHIRGYFMEREIKKKNG